MILITLGIVFALSPVMNNGLNFNVGINDNFPENCDDSNNDNQNLKLSKISGPIYINDVNPSFNWSVAKGAGKCTGNGTYSEPYVIEDYVIDVGGSGSCIWIENSDVYFIIENCTLYNSGVNWDDSGIKLSSDVDNGQLIDNIIHDNYIGIFLQSSDYNTISGNIISNSSDNGINLQNSDYNNISGNIIMINGVGIHLNDSSYNIITGNTINYNIGRGILSSYRSVGSVSYSSSTHNTVSGNTINNNGGSGIDFRHSYYSHYSKGFNTISGNIIDNNNGNGIELRYSYNSGISGNSINNNSGSGIYLSRCHDIYVSINIVINNSNVGISVLSNDYDGNYGYTSHSDNYIIGNTVKNSNIGIFLSTSYSNEVMGNTVNNSNIGIKIVYSKYNDITGNTVNNSNIGIKIVDSKSNDVTGNEVHHNTEYGIYLESSDWNTIQTNTITKSSVGIYLFYSYQNQISDNTFSTNGVDIKDVIVDIIWIVIITMISVAVITIVIIGMKKRKKIKPNKLRLPKDETARYKKLKELEEESTRSHELWIKPLTEEDKKETKKEFRRFD